MCPGPCRDLEQRAGWRRGLSREGKEVPKWFQSNIKATWKYSVETQMQILSSQLVSEDGRGLLLRKTLAG